MQIAIYNPQKSRLETIGAEFTSKAFDRVTHSQVLPALLAPPKG